MPAPYNVLDYDASRSSWDDLEAMYSAGAMDGVRIQMRRQRLAELPAVIASLSNLRYLAVYGEVEDDTAAYQIPTLEELVLETASRAAIPSAATLPVLRRLAVFERPGLAGLLQSSPLSALSILEFRSENLELLASGAHLQEVYVIGTGQLTSLDGIGGCTAIRSIDLAEMRVTSLDPLAALVGLERLRIIGGDEIVGSPVLDLNALEGLSRLKELILTFAGAVQSVGSLELLPELATLRLRGTDILDDDYGPLQRLVDRGVRVVSPTD